MTDCCTTTRNSSSLLVRTAASTGWHLASVMYFSLTRCSLRGFCVEVYLNVELQSRGLTVTNTSVMDFTGGGPSGIPSMFYGLLLLIRECLSCCDALMEPISLLRRGVELNSYMRQEENLSSGIWALNISTSSGFQTQINVPSSLPLAILIQ